MADRKKARDQADAWATEKIGAGRSTTTTTLPERESSRGLEGHGFSASESRVIHRAAGNETYGVEAQRKGIEDKVKSGKPLTNENLY